MILDTAGRLQIDDVLMQELVDIKEAVPVDETLLVACASAFFAISGGFAPGSVNTGAPACLPTTCS